MGRGKGLCPAAPPLGGGAHPCLAEPQPPLGEGCRENDRERGNLAIYCQRQAHVAPSGHGVTPRRAPVFPIEPRIWRCRGDSSQTLIGFVPRLPWESQDVSSLNLAAFPSGRSPFFGVAEEDGSCINLSPGCSPWTRPPP